MNQKKTLIGLTALLLLTSYAQLPEYEQSVFLFTFRQAALSTVFCGALGFLLSIGTKPYVKKAPTTLNMLKLFTFLMPSLVALLTYTQLFGRQGWLTSLWGEQLFPLYGEMSILVAHTLFYTPYATLCFVYAWHAIPEEHFKISRTLTMHAASRFIQVEYPCLKPYIMRNLWTLFCLFYASFTTILILGGGPHHSTLSILFYENMIHTHASHYFWNLLILQLSVPFLFFCFLPHNATPHNTQTHPEQSSSLQWWHFPMLAASVVLALAPFVALITHAQDLLSSVNQKTLEALLHTIMYGICGGILTVTLSIIIICLSLIKKGNWAVLFQSLGSAHFFLPSIVMAMAMWWFQSKTALEISHLSIIVIGTFISLPFTLQKLTPAFEQTFSNFSHLRKHLHLSVLHFCTLVLIPLNRKALSHCAGLAAAMTAGDITAILLNSHSTNLAQMMYQQMGAYAHGDALVTGLVLTLTCLGLYGIAHVIGGYRARF